MKVLAYVVAALLILAVAPMRVAFAMPDSAQVKRVQPIVSELMASHVKDFNAGLKSAKEVGEVAEALASEAEGEAAKYVLLKGALHYYTLANEYDLAAKSIETLRTSVRDIPDKEVASLASKALGRVGKDEAQRLRAIYRVASMRVTAEKDIKSFSQALKNKPGDVVAMRGLADAYVRFGDWPKALKMFAELGCKEAEFELNPDDVKDCDSLKAADYWWNFKAKDADPYRVHAVALYRRAVGEGLVKGLRKPLVEKRIAEVESSDAKDAISTVATQPVASSLYLVIDLSAGPSADKYPTFYLPAEPKGGWTDEYKTTKLVLRRVEPGSFIMGADQKDKSRRVTIDKPFYMGVFEVTQKQGYLVEGGNPSKLKGDTQPVEMVSYDMIRGKNEGAKWPSSSVVDSDSFIGKIRAKTGIEFDLPTEEQWEYACRAGTTSAFNNGEDSEDGLRMLGRYKGNQADGKDGNHRMHVVVGLYKPNAWGLYDMHGNVWEWCHYGSARVPRGGGFINGAQECRSESRHPDKSHAKHPFVGFRLCCPVKLGK